MSEVHPFRAHRFARDLAERLAPPYDVISVPERERLAAEPENVVHLTLPEGPEGERDYAAAAQTLEAWCQQGVLERDPAPALYPLVEETAPGRFRRGFFAALRLADYKEGIVLPHERTMTGPKRDRLLLTREVRANLEPLFFVYEDENGEVDAALQAAADAAPLAVCRALDGIPLSLFGVESSAAIEQVRSLLAARPLVIADGHHRYETMLRYRDECRERAGSRSDPDAGYEFVLAYLANASDPGTEIRPIHRVIEASDADPAAALATLGFAIEPLAGGAANPEIAAALRELAGRRADQHAYLVCLPDGRKLLASRPRGEQLDVAVLHQELLPLLGGRVRFDSRPERALASVERGEAVLALLQNPVTPEELFRVVRSGEVLPQKSTFFAPKVPSGLVLRRMQESAARARD